MSKYKQQKRVWQEFEIQCFMLWGFSMSYLEFQEVFLSVPSFWDKIYNVLFNLADFVLNSMKEAFKPIMDLLGDIHL